VVYNIINKKVLNVLPAPLIVGSIQFGIGAVYCALVWILKFRPFPKLTAGGTKAVASVGAYHMLGQLSTMVSTKEIRLGSKFEKEEERYIPHFLSRTIYSFIL
jgi:predicted phage tail protein